MEKKCTAIIIEDNLLAREALKADLMDCDPSVEIIAEAESVIEGLKVLKKQTPDILFLDIDLGDGNGFDLLEIIGNSDSKVIFTTASEDHAIKAFQFAALDYLLKPIDITLLRKAIKKAKEQIHGQREQIETLRENLQNKKGPGKIILHTQERIKVVNTSNIMRCESSSNYTQFYFNDNTKLLVTRTLKEFDEILSHSNFIRTHQSHLVNLRHVFEFVKTEGGYLVMADGARVPVSFRKRSSVIKALEKGILGN